MNLPIAERELRVASRNPRTYFGRLVACLIFGVITGCLFWFSTKVAPIRTIGAQTYAFVSFVALMMCIFSANTTADVISAEKRNGTLGLLFLTDLKGVDIVFGKLAAAGLMSFYGLVAIIPVLAMPLLMGGISGESVLRTSLTLLNSLFFALAFGLWVSARSWEQKKAMNATVWIALCFLWIFPGLAILIRVKYNWPFVAEALFILSPTYQLQHASPFGVGMIMDKFWLSLGITHALGWLALGHACLALPHAWQDRPVTDYRGRFKQFIHEARFGSPERRRAFRRRLLDVNAVHWLSSREIFAPAWTWFFILLALAGWVLFWGWMRITIPGPPPFWSIGIAAVLIMGLGLRLRTCALAADSIARDRFSGALELLLSTTLTEKDVARGQWLTFRRIILPAAIVATLIACCVFFVGLQEVPTDEAAANAWMIFIGLVTLFVSDLIASVWTGMWMACVTKIQAGATGNALIRLLVFPGAIFFAVMMLASFLRVHEPDFRQVYIGWWLLCIANNLFWTVRSRQMFYERLRIVAAERYQPRPLRKRWWQYFSLRANSPPEISLSKAA